MLSEIIFSHLFDCKTVINIERCFTELIIFLKNKEMCGVKINFIEGEKLSEQ